MSFTETLNFGSIGESRTNTDALAWFTGSVRV